jgi:hypothetical protein
VAPGTVLAMAQENRLLALTDGMKVTAAGAKP